MSGRTDDESQIDDELRSGDVGQGDVGTGDVGTGDVGQLGEAVEVDEVFEVDGDTTGADPDAADPAVNIRPHEPGHLA